MPRNVRNFWIEADIDGRASKFAAGPQAKDGGFTLTIQQRDKGGITKALAISGRVQDGQIVLSVAALGEPKVIEVKTER